MLLCQLYCIHVRLSVDTVFQQVKELGSKVTGMERKMTKAPEDMKAHMEKFFSVNTIFSHAYRSS